jgi:hypothetical protein
MKIISGTFNKTMRENTDTHRNLVKWKGRIWNTNLDSTCVQTSKKKKKKKKKKGVGLWTWQSWLKIGLVTEFCNVSKPSNPITQQEMRIKENLKVIHQFSEE